MISKVFCGNTCISNHKCNHAVQNIQNQQCYYMQLNAFQQILSSKTAKSCTNVSKHSNNTSGQYSMYVPLAIHMYVSINLYPKYACKQLLYI